MKKFLPALLATAAVALTPAALAEGWYVDGGYTHMTTDSAVGDVDLGALNFRGGYDLTENLGFEAEGAFGVSDDSIGGATVELNHLIGAYGKVQTPVGERVNLFARAGLVSAELEASGGGITASDSESGYGIGAGATFDINQNLYVRGDYTRYDIEDLEADAFTVSLGVKF